MEERSCVFVTDDNASTFHPLHLRSDTVKWLSAFGRCETPCIVSLCSVEHSYHSSETKLFAVLHLEHYPTKTISSEASGEDQKIVLISTLEFHNHYGISKNDEFLVVGPTLVFPLSRVVFGARTATTFEWANKKDFETGLMINSTCHKHLLVRQGDQFLGSPSGNFGQDPLVVLDHFRNLTALQSYPLQQGLMTTSTELIIVKIDSRNKLDEPTEGFNGKAMLDEIMHLKFIYRELLNQFSFRSDHFDPQMDVLISEETAGALEIKDCDLLKLEMILPDICAEKPWREVICRVRVTHYRSDLQSFAHNKTSITMKELTLYVSPVLWFNVSGTCKFQDISNYEVKVERLDNIEYPPFASEVHLSLVLSPTYSPDGSFDEVLVKHMSKERILKKGDVVMINVEEYPDFCATCEVKDMSCRSLYYKVDSFSEKDDNSQHIYFRVDLKHASLYQVGTTNSFLPQSIPSKRDSEIPAGLSEVFDNVKDILQPYISMQIMDYTPTILISGLPNSGKWSIISSVCRFYNLNVIKIGCYEFMSDTSGATEAKITAALERAALYAPCAVVLNYIERIGHDREADQTDHRVCLGFRKALQNLLPDKYPMVVIATAWNLSDVAPDIRMEFIHKVGMRSPSEKQRCAMLVQMLGFMMSGSDIKTEWLARQTVRFVFGDLWELCRKGSLAAKERIVRECAVGSRVSWLDEMAICAAGLAVQQCDFEHALKEMQSQLADTLGVPKIPEVSWSDVGGLEDVKEHIKDTIQLPLEHPELFSSGLRRSGVLLYGPPGTGKTMLAKAVATECSLSFLSVKGPELINMYVGQSEENVRNIFSKARDAAPCVIFFDELDSLAPNRGRSGDSGGVMDRVVSQLLAELDGMHGNDREKQVFVIGASNRPDLIDPALLRPGRFDKLLYVGINTNKADQLKILEAQTKKMNLAPGVNLLNVVLMCPENLTGADFFALTSAAAMNAIRRRITAAETNRELDSYRESEALRVKQNDFVEAVKNLVPSVSEEEIRRYKSIKEQLF